MEDIGSGGTGTVHLARHVSLGVKRAIKVIDKREVLAENFLYETNILKTLKHSGIPAIYDIEEDEYHYYIIEEYINGQSLDKYLSENPKLSKRRRVRIALQLCEIVKYLHTRKPNPIIHLDIKPQNILITDDNVFLIDFGNGSFINSGTVRKYSAGTIGYASPEQYQGTCLGKESDLFSLAKVVTFITKDVIVDGLDDALDILLRKRKDQKASVEDLVQCFKNYLSKIDTLSRSVCIAGTQNRMGVTHFALSLVSCLNKKGIKSVYVDLEGNISNCILDEYGFDINNEGIARLENSFCNILPDNIGAIFEGNDYIKIIDCGVLYIDKLSGIENLIVLCGGREWEKENTYNSLKMHKVYFPKNYLTIFNYEGQFKIPYIYNPIFPSLKEQHAKNEFVAIVKKWVSES